MSVLVSVGAILVVCVCVLFIGGGMSLSRICLSFSGWMGSDLSGLGMTCDAPVTGGALDLLVAVKESVWQVVGGLASACLWTKRSRVLVPGQDP